MRETLIEIAGRLKLAPETISGLVRRRAETSDALHRALEEAKQIEVAVAGEVASAAEAGKPKYPNEAARSAEVQKRLANERRCRELAQEVTRLRGELRELDAGLELAKARFRADTEMVFLAGCLIQASQQEDAGAVLRAYGSCQEQIPERQAGPEEAPKAQPQGGDAPRPSGGLEAGTFLVLEARTTATGTVRAYCQAEDGGKVAVYGKNGIGDILNRSVGRKVCVKYRQGDKGLIAVDVQLAA